MSLQDIFYIVAIVTMGIHILTLLIAVIVLISIRNKISQTADSIERRVENIKNFITHPNVVATSLGKMLMAQISRKFRR